MELDRINDISSLYDLYKNMLTQKQQQVISNYIFSNLSLSEIAELENISRQAVKDLLDRTIKLLYSFEEKLKVQEKINKSKIYVNKNNLHNFMRIWED